MTAIALPAEFQEYTLERYETEFADRHLLHGVIAKWAREKPDQPAIIDAEKGVTVTYKQFDEAVTLRALKLVDIGFRKGDFLGTFLPLTIEHIFLEYACFKIGVIHAPLDLRLKGPEVIRSLGLVNAKGFAFLGQTSLADFTPIGQAVKDHCPYVEHFLQFSKEGETIPGAIAYETFVKEAHTIGGRALAEKEASPLWKNYTELTNSIVPTDGAQVIYTTGSTGMPKPALLSHRNITSQNMCLAAGLGMGGDALRQLCHLPPSHVGCQAEQLMTTFFSGGIAIILYVFDAEKTLKAIQEYQVDTFGQVPAMFHMQWRLPNYAEYDLSSVKKILFGGQTVTRQFVEQLLAIVPNVGTGLGLTEMAGFVTYTGLKQSPDDLTSNIGWWMPITPLTIRKPMNPDGTAGEELPIGESGDICFSGPQVFVEYVNNPEAYAKTVTKEGICYTGDMGYITDKGVMFSGRAKFVIKPKGYQIHPGQIEDHFAELREHAAICGAVGAPHDIFGEGVVLFIETKADAKLTREMLETHAKGIAAYMRPSHYVLLEPGTFPLNRVAKTDYVKLGELARAETEKLRAAGGWDKE